MKNNILVYFRINFGLKLKVKDLFDFFVLKKKKEAYFDLLTTNIHS